MRKIAAAKSVRVHDDTHRALKRLKASRRSSSLDQVIREMIKEATGTSVKEDPGRKADELTKFLEG